MFKKVIRIILPFLPIFFVKVSALSLIDGPEHITYDIANNRYIVCNYDGGTIIAIDSINHDYNFIGEL